MIEKVASLRIDLEETSPQVWRVIDVPLSTTLAALHDIIQVAMRWDDSHLYEFEVGEKVYGEPGPDDALFDRKVYKAKSLRMANLVERGIGNFRYIYDFGDNWRHRITIENVQQGDADVDYPRFVSGARRAPPEDVGGIGGFADFLEAMTAPSHEEHGRMREWYGAQFDPDDIDERHVRMILGDFAARRRGPLMSHRTGKRRPR
jgi:hypothetical protein